MVYISETVAITRRNEIIITGLDKKRGQYLYKLKGSRKIYYLPKPEELQRRMFFSGHNLPFVIDSETDRFIGNAQINFVTDNPDALREFIKTNCLNPSQETFNNIFYSSLDKRPSETITESPLFPPAKS